MTSIGGGVVVPQMQMIELKGCVSARVRRGGVKKSEDFADFQCTSPLAVAAPRLSVNIAHQYLYLRGRRLLLKIETVDQGNLSSFSSAIFI